MANYKEQTASAVKWQRANQVTVSNPFGQVPNIVFYEEEVVQIDGNVIKRDAGTISESFFDPTKTFDLIHPETGAVMGTATYQDLYILLSSLYFALATARDNKIAGVV